MRRFHTVCEARTKLIAPASDRFVAVDNPALEQQFFDITQAELKPEIPAYRATDDCRRKAMAVVKRFCILHHPILLDHLGNVTVPFAVVWNDRRIESIERKRMLRLLIEDVTLVKSEEVSIHVRFRGGRTTSLTVDKPRSMALVRKTQARTRESPCCAARPSTYATRTRPCGRRLLYSFRNDALPTRFKEAVVFKRGNTLLNHLAR